MYSIPTHTHSLHFTDSLHHKFPPPKRDSSNGSSRFPINGIWVTSKRRSHAKSSMPNTDATTTTHDEKKDQINEEGTLASGSTSVGGSATSFLSVLCPLLKLFGGGDPSVERNDFLEVSTSSLSSLARFPWGSKSVIRTSRSEEDARSAPLHLQLYEFEACPFCRRVREAMTELDLSVEGKPIGAPTVNGKFVFIHLIKSHQTGEVLSSAHLLRDSTPKVYPCPKGSVRHREVVRRIGGKDQFPFLVDPNTGISMYESGDIVKYLFQQYAHGKNPSTGLLERGDSHVILIEELQELEIEKISTNTKKIKWKGRAKMAKFARIVREALCELELPYILHNVGEGSSKTEFLLQLSGSRKVPYLIDPNTETQLGDYKKILSYLFETYSASNKMPSS
ncbi:hypothetical protein QJS04_geneDACA016253 [Acorus gramineus]|uniref:GST N-terminal domain-containing protein n=1 Tax=Acorus gramineus TaxID=55184 RepID=A0AAV9AI76_ACOGR|nr:hypothetical protein QJS04_geneDACA016253 [Acorus gramineus]